MMFHQTRHEQILEARALAGLATFYNSKPRTIPMKQLSKRVQRILPEEKKEIAKNLKQAVGGNLKDAARLSELEKRIDKHLEIRVGCDFEIGKDLYEIQQTGNFPDKTFEAYVKRRWERTRQWGYDLIDTFKVKQGLESAPENVKHVLQNSRQALALKAAEPEERAEILTEVAADGEVTAKKITEKIEEKKAAKKEKPENAEYEEVITDCDDFEIPKAIVPEFLRAEKEGKEALAHAQALKNYLEADDLTRVEARGLREIAKDLVVGIKLHQTKHVRCPKCEGKKCAVCSKRGFVSKYFADKGMGK